MIKFFRSLFKDIIEQAWTLLGMVVAWLVLEGSAKDVTGMLILVTLGVWIVTFPLRNKEDD
jgi:putative Mn2+ efflux pump MntP